MDCPACGTSAPVAARFCPTCGHALVNRPDERRIATLVFADLVGFTSMSQDADPEHVKRIVDTCFEALAVDVTAYGGRVDKIVGDELVAIFGAPVTHEDDAERAVRCALQMQRTLAALGDRLGAKVEMRVGVNTGEVVVGALRGGGDPTAMGDVVNVASRLQSAAAPGQVLVGPLTQAAAPDAISYEDLGSLTVKGRDEPVAAWRAVATLMPPGRRKRERTPIVGRDAELAMLRGIIDGAAQRSRAHLVLVTADAGVGKSRLVGELVREAKAERDAFVVRSHCVPYGEDASWPIAEMIRDACVFDSEAPIAAARSAITAKIAKITDRPLDDPGVERDTRGLLYLVGHSEELHDVDPTRARDDAFRAVGQLLKALAREHLLIFTIADLQWADEIVLELLERLMEGLRTQRFVVFATTRPELLDGWQPKPGRHDQTMLNLDPLDAESVATLARQLLGDDVDDDLVAMLLERSGGNPFFVEELAALLREAGPDPRGPALDPTRLPATLRGLVAARLDGLAAAERNTLEDCAVIGPVGPIDAVTALSEARGDSEDVDNVLARLAIRELVELEDDEFSFPSEVVRDVAYGTLAKAERARRHATLGDWLLAHGGTGDAVMNSERVAHHYGTVAELTRELGSITGLAPDFAERALPVLRTAAHRATEGEVWRSAARLHDQCLALLPAGASDEERWHLLLSRAQALAEDRELTAARADLDEVMEEVPVTSPERARALSQLAEVLQMEGDYPGSMATVADALALWRELGDDHGLATALRARGRTLTFAGNLDAADTDCSEALELYRKIGDRRGEAWALQNLATISFFQGAATLAEQRLDEAGAMFRELNDWGGLNWSFALMGWVRYIQGDLDAAESIAREQLPESELRGDRYVSGLLGMLLGSITLWQGRAVESVEVARKAVARFRVLGDPWAINQAQSTELRAMVAAGQVEEAMARAAVPPEEAGIGPMLALRAQLVVHIGDPEALAAILHIRGDKRAVGQVFSTELRRTMALALLQANRSTEAIAELAPALDEDPLGPADRAALALAYVAAGRTDEATSLTDPEPDPDAGTYLDRAQLGVARGFAHLQRGAEDTIDVFDRTVAEVDDTQARLDQAIVRLARAHALRALGHPEADDAEHEARARLNAFGITGSGWDHVFQQASTYAVAG